MPTLSEDKVSGDWFGLPSFPYLWMEMEPDVGLLSPARSWKREGNVYTNTLKRIKKNVKLK